MKRRRQDAAVPEAAARGRRADAQDSLALLLSRADGAAVAVNAGWSRLTGLSREDSVGHGWLEAVPPAHRVALLESLRRVADGAAATGVLFTRLSGTPARWQMSSHGDAALVVIESGTPAAGDGDPGTDDADWLLPALFGVSLELCAVAGRLDGPARSRIDATVDRLDQIILDVRLASRDRRT